MSPTLYTPASIASTVQRRAAAWNASRQPAVQNRCTWPLRLPQLNQTNRLLLQVW